MDFRPRFALGLFLRLLLLAAAFVAAWASVATPGLGAARIVAALLVVAAAVNVWNYIGRTNREVARFIEAVEFGDLTASFRRPRAGSGFDRLGEALDAGIKRLRDARSHQLDEQHFYEAIVDDAPAALLTIDPGDRVMRANKAARRLFAETEGVRIEDFAAYGEAFVASLGAREPARRQLVQLVLAGGAQRAMVRSAAIQRLGGLTRVVVVQPIQDALNAVEIAAQSDLIRVLTHEIMNSMTPVTSLARTAAALMAEIDTGADARVIDAHHAVETLARRADGVMRFVETYRQVSRPPQVRRRRFTATPFAEELRQLFAADWPAGRVELTVTVTPPDLVIDADPDLLAQVLINLLRNGAEAAESVADNPRLSLDLTAGADGTVRIEVADNGPGIPEAMRHEVFLPFFTTKPKGTGVGLNLARQVILAHDGAIQAGKSASGGALIQISI